MNTPNRAASRRAVPGLVAAAAALTLISASYAPAARAQDQPAPPAPAQAAPPPAPYNAPPPPAIEHIPDGTEVHVTLNDELRSGSTRSGSIVHFTVTRDVHGPGGGVLIPAGAPAFGHVEESKRAGFFGKPGKLEFTCDYAVLPDGTHVSLRADQKTKYGRDNRGAAVGLAIVVTPLGLLLPGQNEVIKPGTDFKVYVDQSIHG